MSNDPKMNTALKALVAIILLIVVGVVIAKLLAPPEVESTTSPGVEDASYIAPLGGGYCCLWDNTTGEDCEVVEACLDTNLVPNKAACITLAATTGGFTQWHASGDCASGDCGALRAACYSCDGNCWAHLDEATCQAREGKWMGDDAADGNGCAIWCDDPEVPDLTGGKCCIDEFGQDEECIDGIIEECCDTLGGVWTSGVYCGSATLCSNRALMERIAEEATR